MKDPKKTIPPKLLTITAFSIGFSLIGKMNATEQNSLANFFLLIGQTIETNSAQQQVYDFRNNNATSTQKEMNEKEWFDYITNILEQMKKEIDKIKKS